MFEALSLVATVGAVLYTILKWNHMSIDQHIVVLRVASIAAARGLYELIQRAAFKRAETLRSWGVAPEDMPRWVRKLTNPQARSAPDTGSRRWLGLHPAFVVAMLVLALLPFLLLWFDATHA